MKKRFVFFILLFLVSFSSLALAVGSNIGDSYKQKETIIGKLSGSILQNIEKSQVKLLRGHVPVAFDYGVKNLGGNHYVWLIAPQSNQNYTLLIEDVVENGLNGPQIVDYRKNFSVGSELVDFNVRPGIIFSASDFQIDAQLFEGQSKPVSVDFPEAREVILQPGVNGVDFSIENVNGVQFVEISFGHYTVPAYIFGDDSPICGDGQIEGEEVCECGGDGVCGNGDDDLNGKTCETQNFDFGNLSCASDCLSFKSVECSIENGGEDGGDGGGTTGDDGGSGSGGGDSATGDDGGSGSSGGERDARFRFEPRLIKSTVLIGKDLPRYPFRINNSGDRDIDNLFFDYDRSRFRISPEDDFVIEQGESFEFELEIIEYREGDQIRGAIIADVGSVSEFFLFTIGFTEEEGEVLTEYLKEDTGESSSYYCSELSGIICGGQETCEGESVSSLDGSCCLTECKVPSEGGNKTWIGILIAALIIIILATMYFKYKKAGSGRVKRPLQSRVDVVEKKTP